MKTGRSVFVNSAVFGVAIAIAYWASSHHPGGTILLGLMGVALTFAAGYMFFAQRHADLIGDKDVDPASGAGEDLGAFTVTTIWPIAAAFAVLVLLIGTLSSPFLAVVGLLGLLIALWRLGAESNRVA